MISIEDSTEKIRDLLMLHDAGETTDACRRLQNAFKWSYSLQGSDFWLCEHYKDELSDEALGYLREWADTGYNNETSLRKV